MELSNQQEQAIKAVQHWFDNHTKQQQVFYLAGYAGTGKTTLAKYFVQHVDGPVIFGAYTGKAAYVLRQKGCDAQTIHSVIYRPAEKSRAHLLDLREALGQLKDETVETNRTKEAIDADINHFEKLIKVENKRLQAPAFELWDESPLKHCHLMVIDEVSMVDEKMGLDLLSFGVPILVLGDPAQLPPVMGSGFFTKNEPDFLLTEIHRQAKDNPIIHLANLVRQGKSLPLGDYGTSRVVNKGDLPTQNFIEADQILVGKNATRRASNKRIRDLIGLNGTPFPQPLDRLVCLRNDNDVGLLNGSLWYVSEVDEPDMDNQQILMSIKGDELGAGQMVLENIMVHTYPFLNQDRSEIPIWVLKDAQEFDYGYALTCHKAQGSQWDYVVVFDESDVFKQNRHKWLYTAITRAAVHADIIKL